MKRVSFSINLYDHDGDRFGNCILIHINDDTIMRFETLREYEQFINSLQSVRDEIVELILGPGELVTSEE